MFKCPIFTNCEGVCGQFHFLLETSDTFCDSTYLFTKLINLKHTLNKK